MSSTFLTSISNASKLALGLAGCAAAAAVAYAAVTFNPVTGVGEVGKGDLQTPWGWNDAKLQNSAEDVRFYVESAEVSAYEALCTWVTGEGTRGEKIHNVEHKKNTVSLLKAEVTRELKKNTHGKVTGFKLNGVELSTSLSSGSVPVVGQPCPGNSGHDGVWTHVTLLSSSSNSGGLYAESPDAPEGASPLLIWSPVTE
jgi:hypothetical protein